MTVSQEDYKRYYYLWHLVAINAITVPNPPASGEVCPEIGGVAWDFTPPADSKAHIALIDMGVAPYHPNLDAPTGDGQILWDDAIDLASHPYGAKYDLLTSFPGTERHLEENVSWLSGLPAGSTIATLSPAEQEIIDEIRSGCGVKRYVHAYDDRYAAHGTSCAGLTSGTSYAADQFGNTGNIATYFGVDPLSKVLPITTSISPSPRELIAAFLYAFSKDVEVILFPRDVADPNHWPGYSKLDDDEKTRIHETKPGEPSQDALAISADWALLSKVITWVSKKIPVVCAAGNDGRSKLIYPASLSADTDNGVISVGAVSYQAFRSGYSNYSSDDHLTVVAPSDDGEVYNRHQIRLDRQAASAGDFHVDDELHKKPGSCTENIPYLPYSPQRLVTLDVPGPRGYVEGTLAGPVAARAKAGDDPAGLYTEFGGTSGACALVAGAIALMQRKSAADLSGKDIKDLFEGLSASPTRHSVAHWYWLPAAVNELQVDDVNGKKDALGNPVLPTKDELFGKAGLLDVAKLLALV